MDNSSIPAPTYIFQPVTYIKLFGELSVPKAYYDFVWSQAAKYLAKMGSYSDVSIGDVFDDGIYKFISEEGYIVAEQILNHFAETKMLPLTAIGIDAMGRTDFTVD